MVEQAQKLYVQRGGQLYVEDVPARSATKAILGPGLKIWKGLLDEEYLPDLKPWSKAAKIYVEMADDAVIGSLLDAVWTPLLSSEFASVPASQSDEDKKAADFLENNLDGMVDTSWREHVEEMLRFLVFGFAIAEKVLKKHKDGHIHLETLIPVGQDTLWDWGENLDEFGNVVEFRQLDPITGKQNSAPLNKLLHFTFRSRKRDPQGYSLLRGLYRPWFFKKNLEVIEAIGAERDIGGTPIFKLGEQRLEEADITDLKATGKGLRMDEAAYIILPQGVELSPYGGGSKIYNVREMIRDWQHIIRQRFFADFISQGSEQVGTQALAREQTTFFGLILRSIQLSMMEVWQKQLVEFLFSFNRFEGAIPHLDWKPAGKLQVQSLAQALMNMISAKVITPDPELEDHFRKIAGLPERTGPAASETPESVEPPEPVTPSEAAELAEKISPSLAQKLLGFITGRRPVESSNIKDFKYNSGTKELQVTFHNGHRYKYSGVPKETIDGFKRASSKGSYFYSHIRTSFPFLKLFDEAQ